jgi:hypothetical protein
MCRNPTFGRVWGWHSHSRNGDLGVLRDPRNFRVWLQGSKHFALGCSLYHWKVMKILMSKMRSHGPFEHLQHKLCAKEGPGVKLTIKIQESTRPRCVQGGGGGSTHRWKALKESYKFALDLVPIRGLSKELWPREVPGVQTGTISGLHLGSPRTKSHSDVDAVE